MSFARGWSTVVCVGGGESFSEEQALSVIAARAVGTCRVIVCNDGYRRVPNADVLFASDLAWWRLHHAAVRASFPGELWTVHKKAATDFGLNRVRLLYGDGLCLEPDTINCGANGGYMQMGLAYLFGARRFLLVGYDMRGSHWFGNHPKPLLQDSPYAVFLRNFRRLAPDMKAAGCTVLNCAPPGASALDCFPCGNLREALAAP